MGTPSQIASAYARLFLQTQWLPPAQVLAGTGLSEQDLQEVDYIGADKAAIMLRNLGACDIEPAWAARIGTRLSISTHGPLGFAALSAPTLGAALRVMADYHAVRTTSLAADLQHVGKRFRFSMENLTGDDQFGYWMVEMTLKVLVSLIETIIGHSVRENVEVSFAYARPDYAPVLEEIYGVPCVFEASHTAVSIPATWVHIPSPLHDESTYRSNIAKCREIISAQWQGSDPVKQVHNLLATHFDRVLAGAAHAGRPPSLEQIADHMHVTPRTLIRRLKRSDTAYKQLLQQARFSCAQDLLQQAHLTVAEVGHRLGYRDPGNFGRAFRKWSNTTPAAWRRGQHSLPERSRER